MCKQYPKYPKYLKDTEEHQNFQKERQDFNKQQKPESYDLHKVEHPEILDGI